MKSAIGKRVARFVSSFLFLMILGALILPYPALAGVFSFFEKLRASEDQVLETRENSQNIPLLEAAGNITPGSKKVVDLYLGSESVLETETGPSGTIHEIEEKAESDRISVYTVREGENLSQIAEMFGVTTNTIIWANDLKNIKDIKKDQQLIILPISGVKYVVKKGDTIKSVASKFKGDADEIIRFNDLGDGTLTLGQEIIIPDGEIAAPVVVKAKVKAGAKVVLGSSYFTRPVAGGVRTQGLHGGCGCGIDIGSKPGTDIYAAAAGRVIISKSSGWNGGYGTYVVVMHDNGTQTLYAHLTRATVSVGTQVVKGEKIGTMGSSGNSTGTHLHFEVRGGRNPF